MLPVAVPHPSFPFRRLAENVFHGFIALGCASVVAGTANS
jgi:hypothetical protein